MELKDRLKQARKHAGLTQAELARRAGIQQASISELERGVSRTSAHLVKIAQICAVDPVWLSEGLKYPDPTWAAMNDMGWGGSNAHEKPDPEEWARATAPVESNATMIGQFDIWDDDTPLDDDEVYVPFLKEVELSAGSGKTVVEQSHKQKLRFGKLTLRRQNVQPSEAVCVTVSGNSMEPVLPDRSTVGVDQGCTSVVDGKMYALNHDGQLRVKILFRLPGGGVRLRSYNREDHPDEEYTAQEMLDKNLIILGKVFWYSVLL